MKGTIFLSKLKPLSGYIVFLTYIVK